MIGNCLFIFTLNGEGYIDIGYNDIQNDCSTGLTT